MLDQTLGRFPNRDERIRVVRDRYLEFVKFIAFHAEEGRQALSSINLPGRRQASLGMSYRPAEGGFVIDQKRKVLALRHAENMTQERSNVVTPQRQQAYQDG